MARQQSQLLLGLRFSVVAIALVKLQQLTRQNATQQRTVACLRAQLADLGPAARDVNACGVPDDVAPSKEACAGTDDAASATDSKLLEGRKARQPMEPHRRTLSLLVLVRELLLALTEGGARDADEVDTAETVTRQRAHALDLSTQRDTQQ